MKINFEILANQLLIAGMHPVRVKEMVKQIKQDMIDYPELYENSEKLSWALSHGFIPGRLNLYGSSLNEKTCSNYYSDYDYFFSHPLNNHFVIWINDKLTLKYILNTESISKYLPEYYLYVENSGQYTYLMDAPSQIAHDKDFIYNLLIEKRKIAMKPNHGSGGHGFIGLECKQDGIYKNGEKITKNQFNEIINSINGYVVTEYIKQSKDLNYVFDKADCALRIILYKKVKENNEDYPKFNCLMSYARFGSSKSFGTSNISRGGMAVRINWETGIFEGDFRGRYKFWGETNPSCSFVSHPDTGIVLNGVKVPNWEKIKSGLLNICEYIASLDFLGFDVIITDDSFKICEINSAPSIGFGQFSYGKCCLDNDDAKIFVESKKRSYNKSFQECFMAAIEAE